MYGSISNCYNVNGTSKIFLKVKLMKLEKLADNDLILEPVNLGSIEKYLKQFYISTYSQIATTNLFQKAS